MVRHEYRSWDRVSEITDECFLVGLIDIGTEDECSIGGDLREKRDRKRERERASLCGCKTGSTRGDDVGYNNSGDRRGHLSVGGTRSQIAHRFIRRGGVDRPGDEGRGRCEISGIEREKQRQGWDRGDLRSDEEEG